MIVKGILLLMVAMSVSARSSYQYISSPSYYHYSTRSFNDFSPKPIHPYFNSRSTVFYIRPATRPRVIRPLSRSYSSDSTATSTILLNDTEPVPFTQSNAGLTTAEFEANPDAPVEEGVGPAVSFEADGSVSPSSPSVVFRPLSSSSKIYHIISKGASSEGEVKGGAGRKNKPNNNNNNNNVKNRFKSPYEPEVVYSDVHPIYVKPPSDFKPVVYPNRRLDGVRATEKFSNNIPLIFASSSLPYDIPRGLSSWSLGGPKALTRGNYWESLASDEALRLNHNDLNLKGNGQRVRQSSTSPFMPWLIFPASSSPSSSSSLSTSSQSASLLPGGLIRYQIQYEPSYSVSSSPFDSSSVSFVSSDASFPVKKNKKASTASSKRVSTSPSRPSSSSETHTTTTGSRRVNSVSKKVVVKSSPKAVTVKKASTKSVSSSPVLTSSSSPSESEGSSIRTKLPVGLTSWFLGGVRDLSGKHWKMPDLSVDNVAVVPLTPPGTTSSTEDKTDTDDVMMTSDGDFERIPPVESSSDSFGEREQESPDASSPSPSESREENAVVFDDDPEFFNTNNNNVN